MPRALCAHVAEPRNQRGGCTRHRHTVHLCHVSDCIPYQQLLGDDSNADSAASRHLGHKGGHLVRAEPLSPLLPAFHSLPIVYEGPAILLPCLSPLTSALHAVAWGGMLLTPVPWGRKSLPWALDGALTRFSGATRGQSSLSTGEDMKTKAWKSLLPHPPSGPCAGNLGFHQGPVTAPLGPHDGPDPVPASSPTPSPTLWAAGESLLYSN